MITISELFYLIFASFVVGVIFSREFSLYEIKKNFLIALLVFGLHESFHKLAASFLGYPAFIHFSPFGLLLGVVLRLLGSPIIVFVPGYVYIPAVVDPSSDIIISLAGPLANIIILMFIRIILPFFFENLYTKYYSFFRDLYKINYWILIFNLLPVPPLDGGRALVALISLLLR